MNKYLKTILLALSLSFSCSAFSDVSERVCDKPFPSGRHEWKIKYSDKIRRVVAYVPSIYDGRTSLPLIVDVHATGASPESQLNLSKWEGIAESKNFIVLAPQAYIPSGKGFRWNVPGVTDAAGHHVDDLSFINDAIEKAKLQLCINEKSIYGSAFSGGARLLSQYVCEIHNQFAAVGLVAGLRSGLPVLDESGRARPNPESCRPKFPPSIIAFHGTADVSNPINGGGMDYWGYGFSEAINRWFDINGCINHPSHFEVNGNANAMKFNDCLGSSRLHMYLISGGGHVWPGNPDVDVQSSKPLNSPSGIDATELMYKFFMTIKAGK